MTREEGDRGSAPGDLRGRPAVITGGSRGIGLAVARRFAALGADVWLVARSAERLAEVAGELDGHAVPADVSDEAAVEAAAGRIRAGLRGPPEIVVNAAGVFGIAPLPETTAEEMDRHLAVNLRGAFLVIRAFLPGMLERGSGLVVNVGSVAGRKPLPGNAAYGASKYGLRGLHEVLVEELRGTGVRATLLEPSATDTSLWDALEPDADPGLPDRSDMLSPEAVAEAAAFAATRPRGVQLPVLQIERG